mgnify:CR=1 FL=1
MASETRWPGAWIVVPAFNEAAAIGPVIDRIRAVRRDLDLLVVDDGSTDATAERACCWLRPSFTYHPRRKGWR